MTALRRPGALALTSTALGALLALAPAGAAAQKVYRSVDAEGNVIFSDTPPAGDLVDVHRIELPPQPSEAERAAALAEADRLRRAADIEGRYAQPRASPAEIREAERRLSEARAKLVEFEKVQDDDWGGTQQGKRTLKPGYYARVNAAKQEIAEAEEDLKALREMGRR